METKEVEKKSWQLVRNHPKSAMLVALIVGYILHAVKAAVFNFFANLF